ncbi:MAG: Zn-dependent exopeptidase M28 [Thermoplasmatales archaeon]|nr:Zn-dependent exopeptidase M28 [Thermoplasmatales archaeon]
MKRLIAFAVIFLFIFPNFSISEAHDIITEARDGIIEEITEEMMGEYILALQNFGPRVTGTKACFDAGNYILNEFQKYSSASKIEWEYSSYKDYNIEGEIKGDEQIFIVCAHYDTVPNSPGADDNAGGVAAVMCAIRVLSKYSFEHTIRFVAFSGEEEGLLGSHEYAKNAREKNESIIGVLNADMIGYARSEEGRKKVIIQETSSSMWITNISINVSMKYDIGLEIEREKSQPYSDHHSFIRYGYNATFFFEYEFNDYYHSPQDTIDKMDLNYATRVARLIVATLVELAKLKEDYIKPSITIEKPKAGLLYINNREIIPLKINHSIIIGRITVEAIAFDNESGIERVEFYIDGEMKNVDYTSPYNFSMEKMLFFHEIEAKAYDFYKNENSSKVKIIIFSI